VLHDYLWSVAVPASVLTRADADGIFRRAMRELEVPFLTGFGRPVGGRPSRCTRNG
jgi:Protein of unknown function (DUF1353)